MFKTYKGFIELSPLNNLLFIFVAKLVDAIQLIGEAELKTALKVQVLSEVLSSSRICRKEIANRNMRFVQEIKSLPIKIHTLVEFYSVIGARSRNTSSDYFYYFIV